MSRMAISVERAMPETSALATSSPLPPRRDGSSHADGALSDAELLAEIGRSLTAVYVDFLQQPVPRRTADVLNRIKVAFQS